MDVRAMARGAACRPGLRKSRRRMSGRFCLGTELSQDPGGPVGPRLGFHVVVGSPAGSTTLCTGTD
eukprot:8468720-Pyramimonas_sp.AAC.1